MSEPAKTEHAAFLDKKNEFRITSTPQPNQKTLNQEPIEDTKSRAQAQAPPGNQKDFWYSYCQKERTCSGG